MDEPVPIAGVWDVSTADMGCEPGPSPQRKAGKNGDDSTASSEFGVPAIAKQKGLVTFSNLPPAHWKNLFHLELIKERNKPKEAPKKPPSAPFFLQWRGGESINQGQSTETIHQSTTGKESEEEEWKAAWADDDDGGERDGLIISELMTGGEIENQAEADEATWDPKKFPSATKRVAEMPPIGSRILNSAAKKRKKISHHRSHLAILLQHCHSRTTSNDSSGRFQAVTDHIATLGPSTIDVSLSSLCNGIHDLEEGLPLLRMACMWLLEACESRERYEAVNAYLHRFLYIHASVITGIEEWDQSTETNSKTPPNPPQLEEKERQMTERKELIECLSQLRRAQHEALESLNGQLQNSLCLLRHFSRLV